MHLTKYEKETIINWNQSDDECSACTFDPDLKRRLEQFAAKYPECCRLERKTKKGSVTYLVTKNRLSVRLTASYS